jgi:hypothetical protein
MCCVTKFIFWYVDSYWHSDQRVSNSLLGSNSFILLIAQRMLSFISTQLFVADGSVDI